MADGHIDLTGFWAPAGWGYAVTEGALSADGKTVIQHQDVIAGGASTTYQYAALAAGTYEFICSIHPVPSMTGTVTVK